MNRRRFLYAIGSAAAGIAGWALIPEGPAPQIWVGRPGAVSGPRLADGVLLRSWQDGIEILRPDDAGEPRPVCRVNACGRMLIGELDGRRSLQELAESMHRGFDPARLGHTEASVAAFLAVLAQAGLLAEPYFVNLHAAETSA